ncbi:MAG: TrkH family potassium uptake protein [Rhodobacteraceae bacterium]|nr:TrkH family potassium uptake protein [Paracoccaceae bacterium]
MQQLRNLPFVVVLMGLAAAAMLIPALHGTLAGEWATARIFASSAVLFAMLVGIVAIATANHRPRNMARSHLLALLAAYALLPVMLAVPLWLSLGATSFHRTYFEMVSAFTTTGASAYDDFPRRLNDTLHLWRALVGWLGGLLVWITAIAIMAPMNIGGFEILSGLRGGRPAHGAGGRYGGDEEGARLRRHARQFAPLYAGLTLLVWIALMGAGEGATRALILAMATLSTSGITAPGGLPGAGSGWAGEVVIFLFLFLAVSHSIFSPPPGTPWRVILREDREVNLALICLVLVPAVLFAHHWIGAAPIEDTDDASAAGRALWGMLFTTLSFLTTAGFESADWSGARTWSGVQASGLILLGLALMGGGVATTAGGIKLLRVHALYRHGLQEMDRLVHPSAMGRTSGGRFHLRGAYVAWLFFMLFLAALVALLAVLSMLGQPFEKALILAIAALSTTGPLAGIAGEVPILYASLEAPVLYVLSAGMILGRFEMLVLIALLNPDFWRP